MKPWEKYAEAPETAAESGPWTKYATPTPAAENSLGQKAAQQVGNLAAGAVRGAGSIGATILAPYDIAKDALSGKGLSLESNRERRQSMDSALSTLGADTDSIAYQGGKIAGEIAGTAGAGGAVANVAGRVPGVASAAPNLLNAVRSSGLTAGSAGLPTRVLGGAISGGAQAALVNPEDAGAGALIGGAMPVVTKVGGKLGELAGSGVRKSIGTASPEVAALANRAKELGIDIPADRLIDSKPLNAMAAGLNYVPFSGRAATETRMEKQLTRATSRLIGQDSDNMMGALRKAGDELGSKFDSTLRSNALTFDKQLLDETASVFNTAQKELGSDALRPIQNQVDEIISKGSSGSIDGQAAYNIKKTLDRLGRGNGPEAYHALELKRVLLGALDRSLGPEKAAAFAKTRQQYSNMLALEKIAKNGVEGDISVARLANLPNINNEPLQEIANIAAQFVKTREGAHGAAQRAGAAGLMAFVGGPAGLAAGAAAGRASNMALNSTKLRDIALGQAAPQGNQALNELLPLAYRSAPVLGVSQ